MRIALIGLGFISSRHRQAIQESGNELILTCDIDPNKNADYLDYKEMFKDPRYAEVDFVTVATPNYTHADICREVLATGKEVLCEKPLTIYDDYEGLEDVNVVMQLRHNKRLNAFREGNKNIDIFVKTYREPSYFGSWKGDERLSGGILYNMGIHYVDTLLHLLGNPIEIKKTFLTDKLAYGEILFTKGRGTYHIELSTEPGPVIRKFIVNGVSWDIEGATIPLKDSGQVINLHTEVYKSLIKGSCLKMKQAKKSLDLIAKLINHAREQRISVN